MVKKENIEGWQYESMTENRWNAFGYVLRKGAKGSMSSRGYVYYTKSEVRKAHVKAAKIVARRKAWRKRNARSRTKAYETEFKHILHANRYLFFDTETTGLNNAGVVSIAAILTDTRGKVLERYYNIVRPRMAISSEAIDVHGITNDYANEHGISLEAAMADFEKLWNMADVVVAHNISFDYNVICNDRQHLAMADLSDKCQVCTMRSTTKYCGLKKGYGEYKWPRLVELYYRLFKSLFDNQHNAMSDAEAVRKCFFELRKRRILLDL